MNLETLCGLHGRGIGPEDNLFQSLMLITLLAHELYPAKLLVSRYKNSCIAGSRNRCDSATHTHGHYDTGKLNKKNRLKRHFCCR